MVKSGRKPGGGRSPVVLKKSGDEKRRPYNEAKECRGGRWSARVGGTPGRNRDMLDSRRLAPYPELTSHFFGGGSGAGAGAGAGGEMRQRRKHVAQNRKGLASLGTKAAQRAQGRVGAGSSRSPSVPPCPLGGAQTSKWSLPTLFREQEGGRGQPWLKRKNRAGERPSPQRPLRERGQSIMTEDEIRGSGGQHDMAS